MRRAQEFPVRVGVQDFPWCVGVLVELVVFCYVLGRDSREAGFPREERG